jgi:hypothetical protein
MPKSSKDFQHHILRTLGIITLVLVFIPLLGLIFNPGFGDRDTPTLLPWKDSPIEEGWDFFVQRDNPVASLNPLHWTQIKNGEIRNWSEIGGSEHDIILYSLNNQPLTRDLHDSFAGEQVTIQFESLEELLISLQKHPGALTLLPMGTQRQGIRPLDYYPYTPILRSSTFGGSLAVLPESLRAPRDLRNKPYLFPESNIGREIFFISPGQLIPRGWDPAPPWPGGISLTPNPLNAKNLGRVLGLVGIALAESVVVYLFLLGTAGVIGILLASVFQLKLLPQRLWKAIGTILHALAMVPPAILGLIFLVFYPWEPPSSDNQVLLLVLGILLLLPQAFRYTRGLLNNINPKQGREIQTLGMEEKDFFSSLILPNLRKQLPHLLLYLFLKTIQLIIPLKVFLNTETLRYISDALKGGSLEYLVLERFSAGLLNWEMQIILWILLLLTLPLVFLSTPREDQFI